MRVIKIPCNKSREKLYFAFFCTHTHTICVNICPTLRKIRYYQCCRPRIIVSEITLQKTFFLTKVFFFDKATFYIRRIRRKARRPQRQHISGRKILIPSLPLSCRKIYRRSFLRPTKLLSLFIENIFQNHGEIHV